MTDVLNTHPKKRIAIIGSGVSGLTCAHYLVKHHDVTIFEANEYLGGHVNTIDVEIADSVGRLKKTKKIEKSAIDTGFIVFNERTYPNFFRLLDELDVPFQKTDMSFSVKNPAINFEYNGHTLNSLISQRINVLSPKFWQFAKDIMMFNKHIKALRRSYQQLEDDIKQLDAQIEQTHKPRKRNKLTKQREAQQAKLTRLSKETLGIYLATHKYGQLFEDNYLLPMVSAIWSMGLDDSKAFPLIFFAQFFDNHGLLDIVNRPQWFTIKGGSKQYVKKLIKRYADMGGKALVNTPVRSVRRYEHKQGVCITYQVNQEASKLSTLSTLSATTSESSTLLKTSTSSTSTSSGSSESTETLTADFDEVIFACHADVAKRLLIDINESERQVLGAFQFTDNEAILHTDTTALPNKPLAWASWNYLLVSDIKPVLTYHMNILQRLVKKHNYLVTLNESVHEAHVIKRIHYRHPVYDVAMTQAQKRWAEISGANTHTHFAGAYWFNGFHEDGVRSGLRVVNSLGLSDESVTILEQVNPAHLANVTQENPEFTYKNIPTKADKNRDKLNKRQVLKATTHTQLNQLFKD